MARKIKLQPEDLRAQADRLASCADGELSAIMEKTSRAVSLMQGALEGKFINNMQVKSTGVKRQYEDLLNQLTIGVSALRRCADMYKNTDADLAKMLDSLLASTPNACLAIYPTETDFKQISLNNENELNYRTIIQNAIKTEVGDIGGSKYKQWCHDQYGWRIPSSWCDRFTSWLLGQMGYKLNKAGPAAQQELFSAKGEFHTENEYSPKTGDVVFFDWHNNGYPDHVGVIYVDEAGISYVIHGNYNVSSCPEGKVCYTKLSDVLNWSNGGRVLGYGNFLCLDKL